MSVGCPDDTRLVQGLDENLEAPEIAKHLEACSRCRRRVEALFDDQELVGSLSSDSDFSTELEAGPIAVDQIEGFEILREIRRGGQGVVYEARDLENGRRVALKTIHGGAPVHGQRRARFEREITLTAGLDHPWVVTLYKSGETADGQLYFAMEYVEGEDLTVRIRQAGAVKERGELHSRLLLFLEICDAIAHAHSRGVVHRDLKPSNIRIDSEGHPHILDFGLAKQIDLDRSDELTESVDFVGTMIWAAPEQTPWLDLPVGSWTDVYTLGHLLHWLLTVEHPYAVKGSMLKVLGRIAHSPPKLPGAQLAFYRERGDLDAIVARALEKRPRDRYGSVVDLAEDCRCLLEGRAVAARRSGGLHSMAKLARRHPIACALGIAVLILVMIAGFTLQHRVETLERAAALDDLAGVRRAGRPTAFRFPGERMAWQILLSGAPNLESPSADLPDFPGSTGLLDMVRGVYQTMPVEGSRLLPGELSFRGLTGRSELAAIQSSETGNDRLLRVELPGLELHDVDLGIEGVLDWCYDSVESAWYFVCGHGLYRFSDPVQAGATPERIDGDEARWTTRDFGSRWSVGGPRLVLSEWTRSGAFERFHELGLEYLGAGQGQQAEVAFALGDGGRLWSAYREVERWELAELGPLQNREQLDLWGSRIMPILDSEKHSMVIERSSFQREGLANQERESPRGSLGRIGDGSEVGVFVAGLGRGINVREGPRGASGRSASVHGHSSKIDSVLMTPDGEHFVSIDMGNLLRSWSTEQSLGGGLEPLSPELGSLVVEAFAQARSRIAVVGHGETGPRLEVLSTADNERLAGAWLMSPVEDLQFLGSDDEELLLMTSGDALRLWDSRRPQEAPRILERPDCPSNRLEADFRDMSFDPTRSRLAVIARDGWLHLLEFEAGSSRLRGDRIIDLHADVSNLEDSGLSAVAWSPDGEWMAVAHEHGGLTWLRDERPVAAGRFHTEAVNSLASSPDGLWLAVASDDYTTTLWRWGEPEPRHTLSFGHRSPVDIVAFDQESRRIASGDREGRIMIWDLASWPDGEPQFLFQINSRVRQGMRLHFLRGAGAQSLLVGGAGEPGPQVWDPTKLDRFVAGNFEYWSEELQGIARPAVIRKLATWCEALEERSRAKPRDDGH